MIGRIAPTPGSEEMCHVPATRFQICGAKLRLADVDVSLVEEAMRTGGRLLASVRLTGAAGNPHRARLRPPNITWSVIHM